jgi:hypothetical protein
VRRPARLATPAGGGGFAAVCTILILGLATGAPGVAGASASAHGVEVAFGGDLLLGEDVNTFVAHRGPAEPLAQVPELKAADVTIVNLETVVAPGADAVDTGRVGDYFFLGRPESLGVAAAAGIDVVSTANNHARDFGPDALAAEDGLLGAMGLAHPGIGVTRSEACRPTYLAAADLVIAVFAIDTTEPRSQAGDGAMGTCYVAPGDEPGWRELLRPAIADARRTADVVLVVPQFRASFSPVPDPADRAASQLIIDLGADAVIASGAHEFQGIEVRDGRPIVHNAGSLLFNFPEPDESAVFLLTLGPAGVERIRSVPITLERDWTRHATPAEGDAILAAIDARSRAFGTTISGGEVDLTPPSRDPPRDAAATLARLDPGPAPGPVLEPPAACAVDSVPANAARTPQTVGPLTLLGARVDPDRLAGPALIWLETFWSVDAPIEADLLISPGASPERGTAWTDGHEPCEWSWPTSRWKPGVIYRDRHALRPPAEVSHLGGLPALLSMTGYGRLTVSVGVVEDGRSLGDSGAIATVTLDPSPRTALAVAGGLTATLIVLVALVAWRRRRRRSAR